MNSPIISLIVPVYNTEKYIEQCIYSIINQSFKNIEILLIDDGSSDNSPQICDMFADKDDRIKVIHKENGGLSDARNVGIQHAIGEYILFVDSDDFIEVNSLESIYKLLNQSRKNDVIFLEAVKYFEDSDKSVPLGDGYKKDSIADKKKSDVLKHLAALPKYPASACTKLIRRELIIDNDLYFIKGIYNEDLEWTIRLLLAANNYDYCETRYYYYRQAREGSITNTYSMKKFIDLFNVIKKYASLNENDNGYEFRNAIYSFMAYEYSMLIMYYSKLKHDNKKEFEKEIEKYSWLMKYRIDNKNKIIGITYKVLGLNVTSKLLNVYYRIRTRMSLSSS